MSESKNPIPITPAPGFQRDGTTFDTNGLVYVDGQWVRFQRGRARKMGGMIRITDRLSGPVDRIHVYPSDGSAKITCFSSTGIESVVTDRNLLGSTIVDRTPSGFTSNANYKWSVAEMFDDAAGAEESILLAVVSESSASIDAETEGPVYSGLLMDESDFTVVSGLTAKGVFVTQPYAVYYGANGSVTWSNANEPLNITTGDAGSDRVTSRNIVAGLPLPSGNGAGGILWSLDSVVRMDWVGGQAIFRFSHLTTSSSILSQNAVVELDGTYYWAGVDRFFVSNGSQVTVLPNTSNLNWFFDNLNERQRQKVWATVNTRFGEIIWYFPFGDNEECSHAIVYNAYEKCWYDYQLARTAGHRYYQYPVQAAPVIGADIRFKLASSSGSFAVGDQISGVTSEVIYEITLIYDSSYYCKRVSASGTLLKGESVTNLTQTGSGTVSLVSGLCSMHRQEFGHDNIYGDMIVAIPAECTTSSFGLLSAQQPENSWIRVQRIEPDAVQVGAINVTVLTKEFANSDFVSYGPYECGVSVEKYDIRLQGRHVQFKFSSNEQGGSFQLGKFLVHVDRGDIRS